MAEDDDDIANIMTDHFKIAKFRIYKTNTAEECLSKMKELKNKVDLVLVNGIIAAERYHASNKSKKTKSRNKDFCVGRRRQ